MVTEHLCIDMCRFAQYTHTHMHFSTVMFLCFAEVFLDIQFDNGSFEITALVHPNTYINKVLFGSRQGTLQLWNLHKNKQLYNFSGWNVGITVLEQVRSFVCMLYEVASRPLFACWPITVTTFLLKVNKYSQYILFCEQIIHPIGWTVLHITLSLFQVVILKNCWL